MADKKPGRPVYKFKEEYITRAYEIALATGAGPTELAKIFKVNRNTVYEWMKKYQEFGDAVKNGRDNFDSKRIEKTVLERALGFEYDEVTEESIILFKDEKGDLYPGDGKSFVERKTKIKGKDGKTETKMELMEGVKRRITHKVVPPSEVLLMWWLQNRQSDRWKNVQKSIVESHGTIKHEHQHNVDISQLSKDELEQLRSLVAKSRRD